MQRVLAWLEERGDQVWIVDDKETHRALLPGTFRFSVLPLSKEDQQGQAEIPRVKQLGQAADELRRIVSEFHPEIVHLHNITALGLACVQAGLGPLLVSTWGVLAQQVGQPTPDLPAATRQTLAAANALIVDAPTLVVPAQALAKPGARVELLPLGADTKRFRPGRTEAALLWRTLFGIPDDAFVLLSPRMWGPFYGHQSILRAYARAFPGFARPTRLALVGLGDGPDALPHMAATWQEIAHSAAATSVRWLPRIRYQEMPTLYAMSDCVVNYPEVDSFAATLIEAAASQLPIITPLLPTYRNTFVETACTLVASGDVEALAEAMVLVVNQPPAERKARLAEARQVAQREYDDNVIKPRLWALYGQLAQESKPCVY